MWESIKVTDNRKLWVYDKVILPGFKLFGNLDTVTQKEEEEKEEDKEEEVGKQ